MKINLTVNFAFESIETSNGVYSWLLILIFCNKPKISIRYKCRICLSGIKLLRHFILIFFKGYIYFRRIIDLLDLLEELI